MLIVSIFMRVIEYYNKMYIIQCAFRTFRVYIRLSNVLSGVKRT